MVIAIEADSPLIRTTITLIEHSRNTHYIANAITKKLNKLVYYKIYKFQNEVGINKKY